MSASAGKRAKLSETPLAVTRRSYAEVVTAPLSTPKRAVTRAQETSGTAKRSSRRQLSPAEQPKRNVKAKGNGTAAVVIDTPRKASVPDILALEPDSESKYEDGGGGSDADPMDTAPEVEEGRGRTPGDPVDTSDHVADSFSARGGDSLLGTMSLPELLRLKDLVNGAVEQQTRPTTLPSTDAVPAVVPSVAQPNVAGRPQTPAANSSAATASGVFIPPAALEDKNQLPNAPLQLLPSGTGSATPAEFRLWYSDILLMVQGTPRFRPLLAGDALKSWDDFQQSNAKYDTASLQVPYLDSQRALFAFVLRGLDSITRQQVVQEMRTETAKYNLPSILNFVRRDDSFFQDCWGLMQKLELRFQAKSTWQAAQILEKYEDHRYRDGTDPMVFLNTMADYERQLTDLTTYQIQDDSFRAIVLLCRLPASLDHIKSRFFNGTPSMSEVRGALMSWWHSQKRNQHSQRGNGPPRGTPRGPAFAAAGNVSPSQGHGQGQSQGQGQRQRNENNRRHPNNRRPGGNRNTSNGVKQSPSDGHAAVSSGPPELDGNVQSLSASAVPPLEQKKIGFLAVALDSDDNSLNSGYVAASSTCKRESHSVDSDKLIFDSGANVYVSGRSDLMVRPKPLATPIRIGTLGGDRKVTEAGCLQVSDRIELNNVLHIPNAPYSLMSVALACRAGQGHQSVFTKEGAWILPEGTVDVERVKQRALMSFRCENNLYVHPLASPTQAHHAHQIDPATAANVATRSSARKAAIGKPPDQHPVEPQTSKAKSPPEPQTEQSTPTENQEGERLFFQDSDADET